MANLRKASIASATVMLIAWGTAEASTAATFNPNPLFENAGSYSTTISANNDLADIYFPQPPNLATENYSFPVALLLQGANVDKSNYANFASTVARYGFVVVVPNHQRSLPEFGFTGLFPETSQIQAVLTQMASENSNPTSPIAGVVNTSKLGLLGHSAGGAVGLSATGNLCLRFLCEGSFNRPNELSGAAFFGTTLRIFNTPDIPVNNSGIPTALLQANLDTIAPPEAARATYEQIQTPPKAFITILGANHYGITDTNNPLGARPDITTPTLPQDVGLETIARWSGLFLRSSVLDDKDAFDYVYSTGDDLDPNVTVISQTKKVPEASLTWGLVALGVGGALLRWTQKYNIQQRQRKNAA